MLLRGPRRCACVRRSIRFLVGVLVGATVLAIYLYTVGAQTVLSRAATVAPWALAVVVALVVLEGAADGIGVWASVAPLRDGVSVPKSVQFAFAGDFFDTISPAGPVSSEPIMARFISVATGSGYADALGVRSVAKYVKSTTQILVSGVVGAVVLLGTPGTETLFSMLGLSMAGLVVVASVGLLSRPLLSRGIVALATPVVRRVSGVYREDPHDRSFVATAVGRFWDRIVGFRGSPGLLALIALGGVVEQVLTAAALWVAMAGVGTPVAFLPILVVVPLPQIASVVPIPGSLGAYDVLMAGALALVTGAAAPAATAAVLVTRTVALPFRAIVGGSAAAALRGWRLDTGSE